MAHFELNLEQYEKYIFPPAAFFFCWYMAFGKLDKKYRPTDQRLYKLKNIKDPRIKGARCY